MAVKNRIFIPGHNTALSERGLVSEAMLAYHEARAQAAAPACIVSHGCRSTVHDTYARYGARVLVGETDACIPGLKAMARRCRARAMVAGCLGQLFHPGREMAAASEDGSQDGTAPVAPSEVPDEILQERSRACRAGRSGRCEVAG